MRRISLLVSTVFLTVLLTPSAYASRGETIHFASAPGQGEGYLALPSTKGKHPAVIAIQEYWGVDDWSRAQADRFAKQGYVALAPDLYRGKSAHQDANVAHELMRGLPEDRAMADLKGAFDYLARRSDVDPSRIGVIGWCMGGGYALHLAIAEPRIAAVAINYGRLVTDPTTIAGIRPTILGNFGADDRGIPADDVRAFDAALKNAGKQSDIKIYPGAGHAFMNPNNKGGYVKAAAKDAWARIDSFFQRTLKRS